MTKKVMTDRTTNEGERIAKVIARAGICSRRDAEKLVAEGRVAVNGETVTTPAIKVGENDVVAIDGKPLAGPEPARLWRYHKPSGLVTTHKDPEGRPTVFANLPKQMPRVVSVGRLDFNSEGLLLLTNDGGLARVLELPATGWLRRYRVRALGRVTQERLDRLRQGVTLEGMRYGAIEATLDREQGANVWLTFAIREGKNREVRKVLESLGLKVNRLIRVSYGPFDLGAIADGAVAEIETEELRKILGPEIAKQAEADFESPLEDEASPRHPEAREPRKTAGKVGTAARRGPREAQPAQRDGEKPRGGYINRKKRRHDRSGGPRPSRPR